MRTKLNYSKSEIIERLEAGYMYVGHIKVKVKGMPFPSMIHITQFNDRIEISDTYEYKVVLPKKSTYEEIRKASVKLLNS